MWSLLSSLEIGRKSLAAQQAGLQVVSNNIANVNTPGYTRERAVLEPSLPEPTTAGQIGTGVDVRTVESARDQFLEIRISQASQNTGKQDAIVGYLSQIESTFSASDHGLQDGISRFFNSFSTLAGDPTSSSLRYGVVSAAQNMAAMFRSAAQQLTDVRDNANTAVAASVGEINGLTSTIAQLNQQIVSAEIDGTEASTLRDQRSVAINQLSKSLDIHYYETEDGSVSVSTGAGQPLVTAGFAETLNAESSPPNGFYEVRVGTNDITSSIQGGRLGGLLDVRDRLVPAYQADLDTLAESIISQVNSVQATGTDLQVPPTSPAVNLFNPAATVAGAAASFSVNPAVVADARYLAAGQSGAPGDNANAIDFGDLASKKVLAGGTQSFSEAFSSLQFKVGTDQQNATKQLDTENALLTQLNNSRDSVSGVSLDEEAIDLMRFQRAYQAASKFITVIDQLTQDLIQSFSA